MPFRLPVVDPALLERRTASDTVTEALRKAIVTGRFADGEELNQVELAEHFNVSRVPIREALRRLEAEGLVRAEAHRRAVVVGQSVERIKEIFEIRRLLEVALLGRAAPRVDDELLAELDARLDEMDAEHDHDLWLACNQSFHRALYARAGWTMVEELVEQLNHRVERYVRVTGGLMRTEAAGREHRQIVAALRAGDAAAAQAALGEHIERTFEGIHRRLSSPQAVVQADGTAPADD